MLAQVTDAIEVGKTVLQQSSDHGFAAFCLAVLFLTGAAGVSLYFWKVILPERDARITVLDSLAASASQSSSAVSNMAATIAALYEVKDQQARSLGMLSNVIQTLAAALPERRRVLLIVEDSIVDGKVTIEWCMTYLRTKSTTPLYCTHVCDLDSVYAILPEAAVVLLDVILPDSDLDIAKRFVEVCPVPVIVLSGTPYTVKDFPGASGVLTKPATLEALTPLLDKALARVIR